MRHTVLQPAAGLAIAILAVVVAMPELVGPFYLYTFTLALTYLISVLGLNVLMGFGGIVSIGTSAFMMLGAYSVGVSQRQWDWPFWAGALLAMAVCAVAGLITVVPVLRLGPFAVTVVTVAYLSVITSLIDIYPDTTGGGEGLAVRRSSATPTELWYVFAALAFVAYIGIVNLMRSPYGRSLNLSRLSPLLSQSLGSAPNGLKTIAFIISASLSGLSGSLYPVLNGRISTANFTLWTSVLLVLMVTLGGQGSVFGPVLGVAVLTAVPIILDKFFSEGGDLRMLIYGGFFLLSVLVVPRGIAGELERLRSRRRGGGSRSEPARSGAGEGAAVLEELLRAAEGRPVDGLTVAGVTKNIGGVRAVDDVTFDVRPGTVHGLIGPNGSGKTTTLNCISGFYGMDAGVVTISGERVPQRAASRAKAGLARTFQQPVLLSDATAVENVWVGVDRHSSVATWRYVLRTPAARREARRARVEAARWLEAIGLAHEADTPARLLGPGQARLVEVARALAGGPRVVLLDEPAAGLSDGEILHLESIIRAVRAAGITVVLVDHHADLVLRLCDEISVLADGGVIAQGTPDEVRNNAVVINRYLGRRFVESDEPVEANRV
jgi:ABC-type branched-subunit amino acid transport system ATPase component/ABC-type branched-subunit amino acid transport system permease subunit